MKRVVSAALAVTITLFGCGATWAGDFSESGAHVSKYAAPRAPKITCNISMQFWCIVQADAIVNMMDSGDYRTWSITAAGEKVASVIIRESKLCDSAAEYSPRRVSEVDEKAALEQRYRVVTVSLTKDDDCAVQVRYPIESDDWARAAERMARYRLLVCSRQSCRVSLLEIK